MFIFKTRADLHQLPPRHPALPIVIDLLNQIPPGCGYLVLIEEGDDFINLPEMQSRLVDIIRMAAHPLRSSSPGDMAAPPSQPWLEHATLCPCLLPSQQAPT